MSNPFNLVHNKLWDMIERVPDVDDIVAKGNRIKYNSTVSRDIEKQRIQAADVPELSLVTEGGPVRMQNTSSTTMITRRWTWVIATGDKRLNEFLFPVEWMLIGALLNWKSELTALEWDSQRFVHRCDVLDTLEGMTAQDRNRNMVGWSSLWRCEVEMHFKTSDIITTLNAP